VLVGREVELAVLDSLVSRTAAGAGGVVLLAGEPGIGKTRLAQAGTDRAGGATVSWGACREAVGAPPLWPWMPVLRRLGGTPIAAEEADSAAARFRFYERVERALQKSAAACPYLIVIDDVHRADEASLRLLAYLSETLWPTPVGMIVTYRDTEVAPASLTASVIAGLARGPGRHRCELTGLSRRSVAHWLAATVTLARLQWLAGRPGDAARSAAAAQRLHRRWGPWRGIRRGKGEVPGFFKALGDTLQITEFTPLAFASNETDVMVVTRWGATAPATGRAATMDIHHWFRFRDGKICFYRGTEDTALTAELIGAG
jgi:ketosteroid isomerase-like protein